MAAARRGLEKPLPPDRGRSWPGARHLNAADQAELVAAAAALVREPVALIGHSLGGVVAFETAAKLSGRVRVLVAFEPILFGYLRAHGPASAYDEIGGVASRYNELVQSGDWNAVGEWFVDFWNASGTWAAMPDERKQNMFAMLPAVVHEWSMAMTGTRPLEGWSAITLAYAQIIFRRPYGAAHAPRSCQSVDRRGARRDQPLIATRTCHHKKKRRI